MDDDVYRGKEHTQLKHFVLREYLSAWGHKLASVGRTRPVTLWYVDCFAGPWEPRAPDASDTSVVIGLRSLAEAASTWQGLGANIELKALFVEKDDAAFAQLKQLVEREAGPVEAQCVHGSYEELAPAIADHVRREDPALFFVDPLGWTGASLSVLRDLAGPRYREVIVNVMTSFAQRFIGAERLAWIEANMRRLFALDPTVAISKMSEEELAALYLRQLKATCGYEYACDVLIPDKLLDRPKYRLAFGTQSPDGVKVWRDVEARLEARASEIRSDARHEAKHGHSLRSTCSEGRRRRPTPTCRPFVPST